MPRPPSQIIVTGEPVKDSIYAPPPLSDLETPIYIASVEPDMNRVSGPGNIQNLRYNKVDDRYVVVERNERNQECCTIDEAICMVCCFCCFCD